MTRLEACPPDRTPLLKSEVPQMVLASRLAMLLVRQVVPAWLRVLTLAGRREAAGLGDR